MGTIQGFVDHFKSSLKVKHAINFMDTPESIYYYWPYTDLVECNKNNIAGRAEDIGHGAMDAEIISRLFNRGHNAYNISAADIDGFINTFLQSLVISDAKDHNRFACDLDG